MSRMHPDPPAESPYAELPEDLRETIVRSFVDRLAGAAGAQDNLMFGFRDPAPKTAWDALDRLGPMAVNMLVRLFHRIEGIDRTLGTWREIQWIRNQWWGGSAGFKVVYRNPAAMRRRLDDLLMGERGKRVARDAYVGGLEHQLRPAIKLLPRALFMGPRAELPDADTWREVDVPLQEGTHFCVGKSEQPERRHPSLDDIHLDWSSPVERIDERTGRCDYLEPWEGSVMHWLEAKLGRGAPVFTFEVAREVIARGNELSRASSAAAEVARFRAIAASFLRDEMALAVRGRVGYEASKARLDEIERAVRALEPR
ncbi:hypothetical protein [Polyangium jinanense]|uniref:Uncharacterized protein n=1 Tax=Polyangium jinanense TaxID=2829994 RepID=A0A9X3XFE3_9BACT|nr:hypothetical protein [Polyangium jinanense]MDC3962760.1 hypothetical protein [Polyangium jinanense]MDC3989267.1 hypothetical protein [Polyangium jinanense]